MEDDYYYSEDYSLDSDSESEIDSCDFDIDNERLTLIDVNKRILKRRAKEEKKRKRHLLGKKKRDPSRIVYNAANNQIMNQCKLGELNDESFIEKKSPKKQSHKRNNYKGKKNNLSRAEEDKKVPKSTKRMTYKNGDGAKYLNKEPHGLKWYIKYKDLDKAPKEIEKEVIALIENEMGNRKITEYLICREYVLESLNNKYINIHIYFKLNNPNYISRNVLQENLTFYGRKPLVDKISNYYDLVQYCERKEDYATNFNIYAHNQKRAKFNDKIVKTTTKDAVDKGIIDISETENIIKSKMIYYNLDKTEGIINRKCIWLYGKSWIGKSRVVHDLYSKVMYKKDLSEKWFNYNEIKHDIVVLENFNSSNLKVFKDYEYYISLWSDNYTFMAESNGGIHIIPGYTKFIVISNECISKIFSRNKKLVERLRKIFKEFNFESEEHYEKAKIFLRQEIEGINGKAKKK